MKTRLLPSWLKHLDGDVVLLLPRLDVENCSETALEVLKAIFTNMPEEEMLKDRVQLGTRYGPQKGSMESCRGATDHKTHGSD